MRSTSRYLSRQELYQLVWSEPMTVVAKRVGMSDVGLAKACRRALVPVPERGYWAKQKAGKKTVQVPLPPRGLGMSDGTDVVNDLPDKSSIDVLSSAEDLSPPIFSEDISAVTERVRHMVGKVTTIKKFTNPHPLIARLLEEDESRHEAQRNSPFESIWNRPLYDSPVERRRLRVLNTLFLALARCGMKPSLNGRNSQECHVQVGSQHVSFVLEKIEYRSRRGQAEVRKEKANPERLRLRIVSWRGDTDSWKFWEDTDHATIEDHAQDIVVNLIVAGEAQYRWLLQHDYEWRLQRKLREEEDERRRKEEEERLERERLIKKQKDRVDRLLGAAIALRQAADIRMYVETVLRVSTETIDPNAQQRLRDWASWAFTEADRLDPIKSGRYLVETQAENNDHR